MLADSVEGGIDRLRMHAVCGSLQLAQPLPLCGQLLSLVGAGHRRHGRCRGIDVCSQCHAAAIFDGGPGQGDGEHLLPGQDGQRGAQFRVGLGQFLNAGPKDLGFPRFSKQPGQTAQLELELGGLLHVHLVQVLDHGKDGAQPPDSGAHVMDGLRCLNRHQMRAMAQLAGLGVQIVRKGCRSGWRVLRHDPLSAPAARLRCRANLVWTPPSRRMQGNFQRATVLGLIPPLVRAGQCGLYPRKYTNVKPKTLPSKSTMPIRAALTSVLAATTVFSLMGAACATALPDAASSTASASPQATDGSMATSPPPPSQVAPQPVAPSPFATPSLAPVGSVLIPEVPPAGFVGSATGPMAQSRMEPQSKDIDSYARQVFDLMNVQRRAAGLPDLVWNQKIADVSQDWADQLGVATRNPDWDFGTIHRPDAGGSLLPRGFDWYGEIIGFNFTAQNIVDWWMNSPAHRAAILNPKASDVGIGFVVPTTEPYKGWHLVVSNLAGYPATRPPLPSAQGAAAIAAKAAQTPGIGSPLGPVVCGIANGGCYQLYPTGAIIWSPSSGARTSTGAIRQLWASYGFENGAFGYPTTDEIGGLANSGSYQMFQRGAIVSSPATGPHVSVGGIRDAWAAQGYQDGFLGYPTTDEVGGMVRGGVYQMYQRGAIVWSPATGGHVSVGGIRQAWGENGYQDGRLGYPTTNEYAAGAGATAQDFEGGRITWTAASGAAVTFR